jgi:hypothetical protein
MEDATDCATGSNSVGNAYRRDGRHVECGTDSYIDLALVQR